jgi:uncharacterized membrane protein
MLKFARDNHAPIRPHWVKRPPRNGAARGLLLQGTRRVAIFAAGAGDSRPMAFLEGANRMMRSRALTLKSLIAAVACVGSAFSSQLFAANFSGIGYLQPDDNHSTADKLSRDGSTFIGNSYRSFTFDFPAGPQYISTYNRAYIQDSSGKRSIETPPYQNYFGTDQISDVAPFGSAVFIRSGGQPATFGDQTFGQYSDTGPQIWTPDGGFVPLDSAVNPRVFAGNRDTYAGSVQLVSNGFSAPWDAMRHTPNGGNQDLGWIRPSQGPTGAVSAHGEATGISANGNVVVGTNTATAEIPPITNVDPPVLIASPTGYGSEAFRWTAEGGMKPLGYLPGTNFSSATGVSGDGKVVFGQAGIFFNSTGFRWTEETGMTPIPALNSLQSTILNAANFDGSILVGSSAYQIVPLVYLEIDGIPQFFTNSAVIWDAAHGMRELKAVLAADYGIDLPGWKLTEATDISDDGRTIIGNGINPLGQEEGWVVHLNPVAVPEPAAWAMFAIGACVALDYRRRRSRSV